MHLRDRVRVLVVDDNPGIVRTTMLVLQCEGYDVATACNGVEAIEQVSQTRYDVILLDVKMPVMNGMEALVKIRAIDQQVTVVVMTAEASERLTAQALREGAHRIILKPVEIGTLLGLLDEIMRERHDAVDALGGLRVAYRQRGR
jgi:CheY-like chemotaxis protein